MGLLDIFRRREREEEEERRNQQLVSFGPQSPRTPIAVGPSSQERPEVLERARQRATAPRIGAPIPQVGQPTPQPTPTPQPQPRRNLLQRITRNPFARGVVLGGLSTPGLPLAGAVGGALTSQIRPRAVRDVANIAADIPRIFPRTFTSFALEPTAGILSLATGRDIEPVFTPSTPFQRTVFGDRPIVGPLQRTSELQRKSQKFFEDRGVDSGLSSGFSLALAPLGIAGSTALDVAPTGGGVNTARRVGQQLTARYGDDALRVLNTLRRGNAEEISRLPTVIRNEVTQAVSRVQSPNALRDVTNQVSRNIAIQTPRAATRTATPAQDILTQLRRGERPTPTRQITPSPTPLRERGLIQSVRESPNFSRQVADNVSSEYRQISNARTVAEATARLSDEGVSAASTRLRQAGQLNRVDVAEALQVAQRLDAEGKVDESIQFIEDISQKATELGQAVQALALWGRMTPVGAKRYTQTLLNKARDGAGKFEIKNIPKNLSPEASRAIENQANVVQDLVKAGQEGTRQHVVATRQLLGLIESQIPKSRGEKIRGYQNISLLLNPKTFERNVLGNIGFGGLEFATDVVAAGVDKLISPLTGRRVKTLPRAGDILAGARRGFQEGVEDVRLGIDTSRSVRDKFELGGGPTFARFNPDTGKVEPTKILGRLEKALNFTIRVPDRATFEAVYESTVREMMRTLKTNALTQDIAETALYEAQRRTFQDENILSTTLMRLKRAFNLRMNFGLGEAVLKFAQTPGALLMRGIEFTPAGIATTLFDMAKPVIGQRRLTKAGFNVPVFMRTQDDAMRAALKQRRVVEGVTRAGVGTIGLALPGYMLYKAGIVTGKKHSDRDVASLEQKTGQRQYSMNVSALKRFVLSGFSDDAAKIQDDDLFVSYDWIQPMIIPFTMGVEFAQAEEERGGLNGSFTMNLANQVMLASVQASQSIVEQPLFTGLQNFSKSVTFNDGNPFKVLLELGSTIPATFIPSILNNARQLVDPVIRDSWNGEVGQRILAQVMNRIPGLSQKLQPSRDVFGEERRIEGGPLNTLFNPSISGRADVSPETTGLLDLVRETGEQSIVPRLISDQITIPGEGKVRISKKLKSEFQELNGMITRQAYNNLLNNPQFTILPEEEQTKILTTQQGEIFNNLKYIPYIKSLGVEVPEGVPIFAAAEAVQGFRGTGDRSELWDSLPDEVKKNNLQNWFNQIAAQ